MDSGPTSEKEERSHSLGSFADALHTRIGRTYTLTVSQTQTFMNRISRMSAMGPVEAIGSLSPHLPANFAQMILQRYPALADKFAVEAAKLDESDKDNMVLSPPGQFLPARWSEEAASPSPSMPVPPPLPASLPAAFSQPKPETAPKQTIQAREAPARKQGVRPVSRVEEISASGKPGIARTAVPGTPVVARSPEISLPEETRPDLAPPFTAAGPEPTGAERQPDAPIESRRQDQAAETGFRTAPPAGREEPIRRIVEPGPKLAPRSTTPDAIKRKASEASPRQPAQSSPSRSSPTHPRLQQSGEGSPEDEAEAVPYEPIYRSTSQPPMGARLVEMTSSSAPKPEPARAQTEATNRSTEARTSAELPNAAQIQRRTEENPQAFESSDELDLPDEPDYPTHELPAPEAPASPGIVPANTEATREQPVVRQPDLVLARKGQPGAPVEIDRQALPTSALKPAMTPPTRDQAQQASPLPEQAADATRPAEPIPPAETVEPPAVQRQIDAASATGTQPARTEQPSMPRPQDNPGSPSRTPGTSSQGTLAEKGANPPGVREPSESTLTAPHEVHQTPSGEKLPSPPSESPRADLVLAPKTQPRPAAEGFEPPELATQAASKNSQPGPVSLPGAEIYRTEKPVIARQTETPPADLGPASQAVQGTPGSRSPELTLARKTDDVRLQAASPETPAEPGPAVPGKEAVLGSSAPATAGRIASQPGPVQNPALEEPSARQVEVNPASELPLRPSPILSAEPSAPTIERSPAKAFTHADEPHGPDVLPKAAGSNPTEDRVDLPVEKANPRLEPDAAGRILVRRETETGEETPPPNQDEAPHPGLSDTPAPHQPELILARKPQPNEAGRDTAERARVAPAQEPASPQNYPEAPGKAAVSAQAAEAGPGSGQSPEPVLPPEPNGDIRPGQIIQPSRAEPGEPVQAAAQTEASQPGMPKADAGLVLPLKRAIQTEGDLLQRLEPGHPGEPIRLPDESLQAGQGEPARRVDATPTSNQAVRPARPAEPPEPPRRTIQPTRQAEQASETSPVIRQTRLETAEPGRQDQTTSPEIQPATVKPATLAEPPAAPADVIQPTRSEAELPGAAVVQAGDHSLPAGTEKPAFDGRPSEMAAEPGLTSPHATDLILARKVPDSRQPEPSATGMENRATTALTAGQAASVPFSTPAGAEAQPGTAAASLPDLVLARKVQPDLVETPPAEIGSIESELTARRMREDSGAAADALPRTANQAGQAEKAETLTADTNPLPGEPRVGQPLPDLRANPEPVPEAARAARDAGEPSQPALILARKAQPALSVEPAHPLAHRGVPAAAQTEPAQGPDAVEPTPPVRHEADRPQPGETSQPAASQAAQSKPARLHESEPRSHEPAVLSSKEPVISPETAITSRISRVLERNEQADAGPDPAARPELFQKTVETQVEPSGQPFQSEARATLQAKPAGKLPAASPSGVLKAPTVRRASLRPAAGPDLSLPGSEAQESLPPGIAERISRKLTTTSLQRELASFESERHPYRMHPLEPTGALPQVRHAGQAGEPGSDPHRPAERSGARPGPLPYAFAPGASDAALRRQPLPLVEAAEAIKAPPALAAPAISALPSFAAGPVEAIHRSVVTNTPEVIRRAADDEAPAIEEEEEVDLDELAKEVYPIIKRMIAIERERRTGR